MDRISPRQLSIMRHATGWPKCYRNYYNTGPGTDDYADCEHLVAAGMMTRHSLSWVEGYIYTVTANGVEALTANENLS